jgi:hypothetical protein
MANYGVAEIDIRDNPHAADTDHVSIVLMLENGDRFLFETTDGESFTWSFDPDDDEYQNIYTRLKWVWSNDKAFAAVATPRLKDVRANLDRLRQLADER